MSATNAILLVGLPYVALVVAVVGGLYRYYADRFSYTSLSSQLLEARELFWGSVPWHYGIILILLAHLLAGLFPTAAAVVLGHGGRLFAWEVSGLVLGLFTAVGLAILIVRRIGRWSMARPVTTPMDGILLALLAVQVASGVGTALFLRWGARWYLDTAAPWFWSIVLLRPDPTTVAVLPTVVQVHAVVGFVIILLFPFTRLVHLVSVPIGYLWRPYQLVVWDRPRREREAPASLAAGQSLDDPPADDPPTPERRTFLSWLSVSVLSLGAAIVAVPSAWFVLGFRRVPEVWRPVGTLDQFPVGATVEVSFLDPSPLPWAGVTAKTAAWLRRVSDDELIAFAVNCTHLGCPVRWLAEADLFMCPCHGGVYYGDGRVASGPPPRPLTRYPVRIRGDTVEILAMALPIT